MHQTMQSLAATRRAFRQWQLTHGPTHGGFPRLPPTFLTISPSHLPLSLPPSLLFYPLLLCLGINVKWLINTAAQAPVPNDRHSCWGFFVRIHPRSYRRKDMLNKADYTLPMIDVRSVEYSFLYLFCPPWSTMPS